MSKKKRSSTGSLKGFILLVIIIAGALYLYQMIIKQLYLKQ